MENYIPLQERDMTSVDDFDGEIAACLASMGRLRDTYLAEEVALRQRLNGLRKEQEALLVAMSRSYLKDRDGSWLYSRTAKGFVIEPGQTETGAVNGTSHDHEQPGQQPAID